MPEESTRGEEASNKENSGDGLKDMSSALAELDRHVRDLAKEHPFAALAAAVLAGYVAGRMLSRR
jgi:hypothetical protein